METEINIQSQNEVKELLDDYVVSPLNKDISSKLSKIEEKIESLEKLQKNTDSTIQTLKGIIYSSKSLLDKNFCSDYEEDAFDNIVDKIKEKIDEQLINNVPEKLQKQFEELSKQLNTTNQTINENIKENINEILSVKTNIDNLKKQFHFDDDDNVFRNIVDKIKEKIDEQLINNVPEKLQKQFEELSKQLNTTYNKKNKRLFSISLSFGIINTIGIIILIVLYLLKYTA